MGSEIRATAAAVNGASTRATRLARSNPLPVPKETMPTIASTANVRALRSRRQRAVPGW